MLPSTQQPPLIAFIKKMLWLMFAIVILAVGVDVVLGYGMRLARGAALGVALAFVTQSVFTLLSYRKYRLHQGKMIDIRPASQMLLDMTVALVAKWLVAGIGFVIIFSLPYAILFPAVFGGFLLMQGAITMLLLRVQRF